MSSWLGQESPWEELDPEWLPGTSHPSHSISGAAACVGVCRQWQQQLSQTGIANPSLPGDPEPRTFRGQLLALPAQDAPGPSPVQEAEVEKPNGSTRFVSRFPASNLQGGAEGRNGASWAMSHGILSMLGWESRRIFCTWLDFLSSFLLPFVFCPPSRAAASCMVTFPLCASCSCCCSHRELCPFFSLLPWSKACFVLGLVSRRGFRETPKDFSPGGRRWMLSLPNACDFSPKHCREAGLSPAGKGTEFPTPGPRPGSSRGMLVWDLAPK